METTFSKFFRLNNRDYINGAVIAFLGVFTMSIGQGIEAGTFNIFTYDWLATIKVAGGATALYLIKNLLTFDNGKVLGKI